MLKEWAAVDNAGGVWWYVSILVSHIDWVWTCPNVYKLFDTLTLEAGFQVWEFILSRFHRNIDLLIYILSLIQGRFEFDDSATRQSELD